MWSFKVGIDCLLNPEFGAIIVFSISEETISYLKARVNSVLVGCCKPYFYRHALRITSVFFFQFFFSLFHRAFWFIKFYSHQLMHLFIQLCISLLSYIKIT